MGRHGYAAVARPRDPEQALRRGIAPAHAIVGIQQYQRIRQCAGHGAQVAQLGRQAPRARAIGIHGDAEKR
jgi:hypothetical protein